MITVITYIMALAFQFMGLSVGQEKTNISYFENCSEISKAVSYRPTIGKIKDSDCDKNNSDVEKQTNDEYLN